MNIQSTENILLLGAGFTKNFGGLLANEMWAEIFNHEKIQAHPTLKKLMLNNFDYESVYFSVLEGFNDKEGLFGEKGKCVKFNDEEKDSIKKATISAYKYIDEILREHVINHPHPIELNYVNDLISEIGSQSVIYEEFYKDGVHYHSYTDTKKKSFIFTLNQDLFFERLYSNRTCAELSIPGINNNPVWFTTNYNESLEKFGYCELPNKNKLDNQDILSKGNYFLIKLHGSCNWTSFDGSDIMVIGRGKEKQMREEPLLNLYFDIFKEVLLNGRHRLFIIGYGFGDKHINEIISKAVIENELKVYILSPESPKAFNEKLCKGPEKSEDTINIWNGVSGYFQCVEEILINSNFENQTKKGHFYEIFFDRND